MGRSERQAEWIKELKSRIGAAQRARYRGPIPTLKESIPGDVLRIDGVDFPVEISHFTCEGERVNVRILGENGWEWGNFPDSTKVVEEVRPYKPPALKEDAGEVDPLRRMK